MPPTYAQLLAGQGLTFGEMDLHSEEAGNYWARTAEIHELLRQRWSVVGAPAPLTSETAEQALRPTNAPRRRYRRTDSEVDDLFEALKDEWQQATRTYGSVHDAIMHPAYQRIIGLGPQAVPLIIDELSKELDHWFWALTMIVGEDVAAKASTLRDAAELWLAWADDQGLLD